MSQSLSQSLGDSASAYSVMQAAFSLPAQQFWLFCISPLMDIVRFVTDVYKRQAPPSAYPSTADSRSEAP